MEKHTQPTRRQALQAGGLTAAWLLVPVGARAIADAEGDAIAVGQPGLGGLPRWFDVNRVQGMTTSLGLGARKPFYLPDSDEFAHAGAALKALGAGVFTRHVKLNNGDPWWPTAKPRCEDGTLYSQHPRDVAGYTLEPGVNLAQQIIDEAHREGLKIIAYYFHMAERTLSAGAVSGDCVVPAHDEWVCRDPEDKPITFNGDWLWLDITGPYREVVLTRLLELADMGVDGFNFDDLHLPREGCWRTALADAWIAETGEPAPKPPNDGEQADPRYLDFLDFRARRIEDTFTYWRDQVKAKHPDVVFVISTTQLAFLSERTATTRLAAIADSAKNEYNDADKPKAVEPFKDPSLIEEPPKHLRQAFGWTAVRDASDGRPPRIWVKGVPSTEQDKTAHAMGAAGSLLTFGGIAHMAVAEENLVHAEPVPGKTSVAGLKAAFALGDTVSPYLARTRPLRWAAVHFPELARNERGDDSLAKWQEVLWPMVGAFWVLSEEGVPVGVVTDDQLEDGALRGYELLVLPDPNTLNDGQRSSVDRFKLSGGAVIENDPAWPWSTPGQTDEAKAAFRTKVLEHAASAPVRVTGGPDGRYAVIYHRPGRLVVAVTNDFGWVQITKRDEVPKVINEAPAAAEGVRAAWKPELLPTPVVPPRPSRPRATEAISGTELTVHEIGGGYRVDLPPFPFMALVVITWK